MKTFKEWYNEQVPAFQGIIRDIVKPFAGLLDVDSDDLFIKPKISLAKVIELPFFKALDISEFGFLIEKANVFAHLIRTIDSEDDARYIAENLVKIYKIYGQETIPLLHHVSHEIMYEFLVRLTLANQHILFYILCHTCNFKFVMQAIQNEGITHLSEYGIYLMPYFSHEQLVRFIFTTEPNTQKNKAKAEHLLKFLYDRDERGLYIMFKYIQHGLNHPELKYLNDVLYTNFRKVLKYFVFLIENRHRDHGQSVLYKYLLTIPNKRIQELCALPLRLSRLSSKYISNKTKGLLLLYGVEKTIDILCDALGIKDYEGEQNDKA